MYTCEICKREHETIADRAKCEIRCLEKQKIEAERKRREEQLKRKTDRKSDIQTKCEELENEIKEYYNDYGEYPDDIHINTGKPNNFVKEFDSIIDCFLR